MDFVADLTRTPAASAHLLPYIACSLPTGTVSIVSFVCAYPTARPILDPEPTDVAQSNHSAQRSAALELCFFTPNTLEDTTLAKCKYRIWVTRPPWLNPFPSASAYCALFVSIWNHAYRKSVTKYIHAARPYTSGPRLFGHPHPHECGGSRTIYSLSPSSHINASRKRRNIGRAMTGRSLFLFRGRLGVAHSFLAAVCPSAGRRALFQLITSSTQTNVTSHRLFGGRLLYAMDR
ncbi:hypothetical protein DFH06DRAFT_1324150 [Mycena polygramma]|nr:hypothetical protein DFH06DRAFT_1324150 [Mycena polygramma]